MTIAQLPRLPTSMVGRERELGEISALLREPQCRLVTLLGPGGIRDNLALLRWQESPIWRLPTASRRRRAGDSEQATAARLLGGVDAALQTGAYNTRISLLLEIAERTAADVQTQLPAGTVLLPARADTGLNRTKGEQPCGKSLSTTSSRWTGFTQA